MWFSENMEALIEQILRNKQIVKYICSKGRNVSRHVFVFVPETTMQCNVTNRMLFQQRGTPNRDT